ncbi:histone-like nucleoid-structuring protein Lsr2 [Williamsia sterculiae]|uniref:Lsr2 protein n=1 Tax=Williamsia sterculiae TaxID=1344003 RepID=A0A1N7HFV4_9NOCA|nr:Lsr2 family protein [Williamsia sterculiae]SIS23766.1 Lsr2 protein [Williamsia sterculiae]
MAQKKLVQFIDDLDGKVLTDFETVRFAVDGKDYEFDTSPAHAEQFRKLLEKYVTVSRLTRPGGRSRVAATSNEIREWALENGYDVNSRGRVPGAIVAAFESNH